MTKGDKTREQRVDFLESTKRIIAQRAGAKCSYPTCGKTLVGPGQKSNKVINVGECAHIFSAVENGPRGDGGLTDEELKSPENGIYLCREHHKIIDAKSESNMYSPDILAQLKYRHELSISAEIGEYLFPLNWINSVYIKECPVWISPVKINLGKVTHVFGKNGVGKSAFVEYIESCFKQKINERWNSEEVKVDIEFSMDNPIARKFGAKLDKGNLSYIFDNELIPFPPYLIQVIKPVSSTADDKDNIQYVSDTLGIDEETVFRLLGTIGVKHGLFAESISIVIEVDDSQDEEKEVENFPEYRNLEVVKKGSSSYKWTFDQLSDTEQASVLLDILISFATELCKFRSILLILDWDLLLNFHEKTIRPYLEYLMSPEAHFQTIYVTPRPSKDTAWLGWSLAEIKEKVETPDRVKEIEVSQTNKF